MKKIIGFVLTLGTIATLAACSSKPSSTAGSKTDSSTTTSAKKSEVDYLQKIKDKGELVMGTSPDFAPFEFPMQEDGKNKIVGSDVDLANEVAKALGVKLKVMQLDFDNLLPSLQANKLDIVLAGVSATEERQKNADFSTPYYTPEQKVVVKKDKLDTYTTPESLAGKSVGAQKGSVQEDVTKEQISKAKLVSIPKTTTMLIQIQQGGLEAMVLEGAVAESYVKQNKDLAIANIDLKSSDDEAYAVALPKDSGTLKEEVDKVIKELQDSGKINEFIQKNTELAEENAK